MKYFSRHFFFFMIGLSVVLAFGVGAWSLMEENARNKEAFTAGRNLRVGLEEYYPPFAMKDAHGNHTGFDYDMAVALCKTLKAECEYVVKPFDEVLTMMAKGELDFMVAGLAALDTRRPMMDFTESYYRSRTVYIGRPGLAVTEESLRGKRLGGQEPSMQLDYLRRQWGNVSTIVPGPFQDITEMLRTNEVDAVLVDGLVGYAFLKSEQGIGFDLLGEPLEIDDVLSKGCISVRKGDTVLRHALNDSILSVRLTGEYDRITRKYFAFSIY